MTTPEPSEEPVIGETPEPRYRPENPIVDWARAIYLGLRDTGHDALEEGRRAARRSTEANWRKFDTKTRPRRTPRP
jgi:hypothetical protein